MRAAFDMTNSGAAKVFGRGTRSVAVGEQADIAVLNATTLVDVFRNLPGRRIVIRKGHVVGGLEGSWWTAGG